MNDRKAATSAIAVVRSPMTMRNMITLEASECGSFQAPDPQLCLATPSRNAGTGQSRSSPSCGKSKRECFETSLQVDMGTNNIARSYWAQTTSRLAPYIEMRT